MALENGLGRNLLTFFTRHRLCRRVNVRGPQLCLSSEEALTVLNEGLLRVAVRRLSPTLNLGGGGPQVQRTHRCAGPGPASVLRVNLGRVKVWEFVGYVNFVHVDVARVGLEAWVRGGYWLHVDSVDVFVPAVQIWEYRGHSNAETQHLCAGLAAVLVRVETSFIWRDGLLGGFSILCRHFENLGSITKALGLEKRTDLQIYRRN